MSKKKKNTIAISDVTKKLLKKVGLDYKIHKICVPVKFYGVEYKNNYHFLLNPKTREVINTVKPGYFVTQNDVIMEMVRRGVKNFKDITFHGITGGELHGGRRIFVQLAISGEAVIGGDRVKQYITIIDSNDGSAQLCVGIGDEVRRCENQFYQFYAAGQSKFKHTASLELRIAEIPHLIEAALSRSLKMVELYNKMYETPITLQDRDRLVESLLGYSPYDEDLTGRAQANLNKLLDALDIELKEGMNAWALHNGVTRWTTHTKQAPKRENGRLEGLMTGTNYKTNQKSFEFALELIGEPANVLDGDLVLSN